MRIIGYLATAGKLLEEFRATIGQDGNGFRLISSDVEGRDLSKYGAHSESGMGHCQ